MVMYYGKYKVFKWCWDANLHSDGLKNNIQCTSLKSWIYLKGRQWRAPWLAGLCLDVEDSSEPARGVQSPESGHSRAAGLQVRLAANQEDRDPILKEDRRY